MQRIKKKSENVLQLICGKAQSKETTVDLMTTTGQREWASSLRKPENSNSYVKSPCVEPSLWKNKAMELARKVYGSPYKQHFATCRNPNQNRTRASKSHNKVHYYLIY